MACGGGSGRVAGSGAAVVDYADGRACVVAVAHGAASLDAGADLSGRVAARPRQMAIVRPGSGTRCQRVTVQRTAVPARRTAVPARRTAATMGRSGLAASRGAAIHQAERVSESSARASPRGPLLGRQPD